MVVSNMVEATFRWSVSHCQDKEALRALADALRDGGLPPPAIPGMDPALLAEGLEGDDAGAIIAYEHGAPVAYLTYALERKSLRLALGPFSFGRLPVRQLRIFGYNERERIPTAMLDRMAKLLFDMKRWHMADVLEASPDDRFSKRLIEKHSSSHRVARKEVGTIQLRLEDSFEDYLAKHFRKKVRYNLKREVRLLEEAAAGGVRMEIYEREDQAENFIREAERIAKLTYQWKMGLETLRVTPRFLRKTAYLARCGKWRGYMLYIQGAPAAFCYTTVRHGELSYDVVGYDPQFHKLNPGKVLLFKMIEELHETRYVDVLDFGRGLAEYKMLFANANRPVLDISFFPHKVYPQTLWLLTTATENLYQELRPRLRQWMPTVKKWFRKAVALLLPGLPDEIDLMSELALCMI